MELQNCTATLTWEPGHIEGKDSPLRDQKQTQSFVAHKSKLHNTMQREETDVPTTQYNEEHANVCKLMHTHTGPLKGKWNRDDK